MKEIFGAIVTSAGLIAIVAVSAMSFDNWQCGKKSAAMQLPGYWSIGTGCMVQDRGRWYPIDKVWANGVNQ